jgi:PAS domain S-box-containing protein
MSTDAQSHRPRILIIDDNHAIHDDLRKILAPRPSPVPALAEAEADLFGDEAPESAAEEFEISSAYQGQEGVSMVREAVAAGRPFALAIVDMRMPPGWDGLQTTARLWQEDPDLQVVICTAFSDYSFNDIVNRLGRSDRLLILKKPFDIVEVLQLASTLVEKWRLSRAARARLEELDELVEQRTRELTKSNQQLSEEIHERKQTEATSAAFSALGRNLSAAKTAREAAQIITAAADQLLGWDSCVLNLYSAEESAFVRVFAVDIFDGKRKEEPEPAGLIGPSATSRRVMEEGPQLILRQASDQQAGDTVPFGDKSRRSASLLYVPIRNGPNLIGIFSIQSYQTNAYDRQDLETLDALAAHCAGALDRIRTEEKLLAAQQRLNHLLGHSPTILYSLKTEGKTFTTAWVSENSALLLGYNSKEACAPGWWEKGVHSDDRSVAEAGRARSLVEGQSAAEYRFRHRDGTYRWLRDEQRLLKDQNGKPVEIVGNWLEITERKALESQLRQAQKMEAVGELAGGVAHDFNNLLAVIRGYTELLLAAPERLRPETADCLKQVLTASDRAARLTRQLLAFSRKQVIQLQPLDLNQVLSNTAKMLKRLIGENIRLECQCAPELPLVRADVGMLEQVLVNLAVNARDAMPNGGDLIISTGQAGPVGLQANPDLPPVECVSLAVMDNGTGIAPENLARIFEPFFTTKEVGKGTGLGLATVYGIVKQHQGTIQAANRPEGGAQFTVLLPRIESAGNGAPAAAKAALLRGGSEKILLVEDDEAVRTLIRRILETLGYHIREASSGREALGLEPGCLRETDLLLTDMVMPGGLTGRELAERLMAQIPGLKVIFMSGYSGEAVKADSDFLARTKIRFLQKPCPWHDLVQAVRLSLDEKINGAGEQN